VPVLLLLPVLVLRAVVACTLWLAGASVAAVMSSGCPCSAASCCLFGCAAAAAPFLCVGGEERERRGENERAASSIKREHTQRDAHTSARGREGMHTRTHTRTHRR
jgi:hypothetical protein